MTYNRGGGRTEIQHKDESVFLCQKGDDGGRRDVVGGDPLGLSLSLVLLLICRVVNEFRHDGQHFQLVVFRILSK